LPFDAAKNALIVLLGSAEAMKINAMIIDLSAEDAAVGLLIAGIKKPFIPQPSNPREFNVVDRGLKGRLGLCVDNTDSSPVAARF